MLQEILKYKSKLLLASNIFKFHVRFWLPESLCLFVSQAIWENGSLWDPAMLLGRWVQYSDILVLLATFQFSGFPIKSCQLPSMLPNSWQAQSDELYWSDQLSHSQGKAWEQFCIHHFQAQRKNKCPPQTWPAAQNIFCYKLKASLNRQTIHW